MSPKNATQSLQILVTLDETLGTSVGYYEKEKAFLNTLNGYSSFNISLHLMVHYLSFISRVYCFNSSVVISIYIKTQWHQIE